MGLIDTKTVDSTGNVINKIESTNIDPHLTKYIVIDNCHNFVRIYTLQSIPIAQ